MGRRPRNRLELRAEAEAAEALGLNTPPEKRPDGTTASAADVGRKLADWATATVGHKPAA